MLNPLHSKINFDNGVYDYGETILHASHNSCSKDFGAEVRQLFQVITSDELSPPKIKEILAKTFGNVDCTLQKEEENYSKFLTEQAR